jgi:hypothetical protein
MAARNVKTAARTSKLTPARPVESSVDQSGADRPVPRVTALQGGPSKIRQLPKLKSN